MDRDRLTRAQKKAQNEERTLLYIDESAFYPLPGVVTTWAPSGETPVLRCKLTRDHLPVISAISPAGKLYLAMQETAFDDEGIWHYLKHIELKNTCCADLADLRQKLTTATDSLSHKSEIIKACFAQVGYY